MTLAPLRFPRVVSILPTVQATGILQWIVCSSRSHAAFPISVNSCRHRTLSVSPTRHLARKIVRHVAQPESSRSHRRASPVPQCVAKNGAADPTCRGTSLSPSAARIELRHHMPSAPRRGRLTPHALPPRALRPQAPNRHLTAVAAANKWRVRADNGASGGARKRGSRSATADVVSCCASHATSRFGGNGGAWAKAAALLWDIASGLGGTGGGRYLGKDSHTWTRRAARRVTCEVHIAGQRVIC
jgi:hypothetical protein